MSRARIHFLYLCDGDREISRSAPCPRPGAWRTAAFSRSYNEIWYSICGTHVVCQSSWNLAVAWRRGVDLLNYHQRDWLSAGRSRRLADGCTDPWGRMIRDNCYLIGCSILFSQTVGLGPRFFSIACLVVYLLDSSMRDINCRNRSGVVCRCWLETRLGIREVILGI